VVADFNGDGKLDIAVANSGLSSTGANSVSVFVNNRTAVGTISFATRADFNGGNRPVAIVAADFHADTKIDLAVAHTGLAPANHCNGRILPGNGGGGFGTRVAVNVNLTTPSGLAVGNLNADTKPGLAVSAGGDALGAGGGVKVLSNTSTAVGTFSFTVSS